MSTRTGAVSSVTRAAVRDSVTEYGRMPGVWISFWPYCTTTVPPARA